MKEPAPDLRAYREATIGSASSIRVVSEVTGLAMDTLRAWERRYGFPKPVRREDSNRRLYSAEDLEKLGWVARALERGYRPGDVIDKAPSEIRTLLGPPGAQPLSRETHAPAILGNRSLAPVSALIALLSRDDVGSIEAELRLAAAALGPRRFVTDLAQPLAVAVGEAWAAGHLAIRQEHIVTECLTTQLRLLLAAQQDVAGGPVVVLATLPTEAHTLGLQMAAVYLSVGGAKPRLLGADTPPNQIVEAAAALRASAVGLTVTPTADVARTRQGLRSVARSLPHVAIWLGGGAADRFAAVAANVRAVPTFHAIDEALRALASRPRRRSGERPGS